MLLRAVVEWVAAVVIQLVTCEANLSRTETKKVQEISDEKVAVILQEA